MDASFSNHSLIRTYLIRTVGNLSDAQWLTIPEGFDNNIAWNIGHLVTAQMGIIYYPCRLRLEGMMRNRSMYVPGTSPADWDANPDPKELYAALKETSRAMAADYAAGKFKDVEYRGMTTVAGAELTSLAQGVSFNNFHEGMHLGTIMSIKNFLK